MQARRRLKVAGDRYARVCGAKQKRPAPNRTEFVQRVEHTGVKTVRVLTLSPTIRTLGLWIGIDEKQQIQISSSVRLKFVWEKELGMNFASFIPYARKARKTFQIIIAGRAALCGRKGATTQ